MQFHHNGFHPHDPTVAIVEGEIVRPALDGAEVDVLIVGSGPAGLMLAAYLSQFPDITTRIVERREGPLVLGQADGIACRTVETFEAFGLAKTLVEEGYRVTETSFWRPNPDAREDIVRTGLIDDVEEGLSEFPHIIVNQARINDYLLGFMARSATRLDVDYDRAFTELSVDRANDHPVSVVVEAADGTRETIRAKYVVGTDGARSGVRKAIGRSLHGEAAGHAWGVMDVLAVSDFPDWRIKAAIQSEAGSILLIPREGGFLVRVYVDLGTIDDTNRAEVRGKTKEQLVEAAQAVLHPYTLDVKDTVWWSIYEVAQRVTDGFDDASGRDVGEPRVFIAGDACHTHSAKAGQGMNVSMQDTLNLGWKLAAVLQGQAKPELLETYDGERLPIAERLIAFDKEWSAMMAAAPKDPEHPERGGVDPDELQAYFQNAGRYTAGVATVYAPALLTGDTSHQALATGFDVGMRFHSWPVTRVADAQHVHLGHVHRADGRWRLYAFAGADEQGLHDLCDWLEHDPSSPVVRHSRGDLDSVIDVRGVLQRGHRDVEVAELPTLLRPHVGRYGLIDHEKAFSGVTKQGDIFDARGIDREQGAIVLVRPDQYIAQVLPLSARTELGDFFAAFLN